MALGGAQHWQSGAFAAVIHFATAGMTLSPHRQFRVQPFNHLQKAVTTMDHKRNLLIAALAVISYLLLLAWNKDYQTPAPTPVPVTTVSTSQTQSLDLPAAPTAGSGGVPAQAAASAASSQPTLISVQTPNQKVLIDTIGGDIVSLSLPRYPTSIDAPGDAFTLLKNDSTGVYVAQSGLIGRNGPDANGTGRPRYTSQQTAYSIDSGELSVDLTTTTAENVSIVKRFIFSADDYLIRQQFIITNQGASDWSTNLFGQIKRDATKLASNGMRLNNFLGAAMTSEDDPYIKVKFDDIDDGEEPINMAGGWIAFSQHYFLGAWIPAATDQNTFSVRRNDRGEYLLGFVTQERSVAPGASLTLESSFWAGPKNQDRLEEIAPNLGLTIDYGMLWFVAYPIFHLLSWINALVGNYGVAIILLTVVIRTLFYPLSAKQFASQAGMKRLQPKIAQLKDRYGDDKQALMQAQMELWKKEKVSPFSGCLPMFLQMPVFLGIYWVLNESVELRQAPFMLWYQDLSALDPYFILPILLGGVYFLQQHMNPMPTTDPVQARMMKFMPIIFSVFFLWFPAGLVLYYLANALLGILQQWYFNSRLKTVTADN